MKPLSQSSYNKWRCLIALAHVDNKVQPSEKEFFINKFKSLENEGITEEQMAVFKADLQKAQDPKQFFLKVEDRLEKLDLLRLAYELFWIDGEFDDRERKAFEDMKRYTSKSLNIQRFILDDLSKMKDKKITLEQVIKKTLNDA